MLFVFSSTVSDAFNPSDLSGLDDRQDDPKCDLPGVDLAHANKYETNIYRANFSRANLTGAGLDEVVRTDGAECREGSVGTC
jgi:uncharacterized protein YjbI with pentapeptide repeats